MNLERVRFKIFLMEVGHGKQKMKIKEDFIVFILKKKNLIMDLIARSKSNLWT